MLVEVLGGDKEGSEEESERGRGSTVSVAASTVSVPVPEANQWEQRTRATWLHVQREERKPVEERTRENLYKGLGETTASLEQLNRISHRVDAETKKALRQSWKHCLRYAIQASIWLHCELARVGEAEPVEAFADLLRKFMVKHSDTLRQGGVCDSTIVEMIVKHIKRAQLPVDLFVPLVEDSDQYLDLDDKRRHRQRQNLLKLNLDLISCVLPFLAMSENLEELVGEERGKTTLDVKKASDLKSLAVYALQFCRDPRWQWEPSWTNAELSELSTSILASLLYGAKVARSQEEDQRDVSVFSATLNRNFPTLPLEIVERYSEIMLRVEAQTSLYAVEDNESAFDLTALLYTLHWLMTGMSYRSFVDQDYNLSEALFPVILHACKSSTQSMQYCGLQCLSLLLQEAPATVIKWHKSDLYSSLEKYLQHSETVMWSVAICTIVETYIVVEGKKNKNSERLLGLMENLVEQGEVMVSPRRFTLWFQTMSKLVPCLGVVSSCFFKRILSVLHRWLDLSIPGTDYGIGLQFIIVLVDHCWPAIQRYEQDVRGVITKIENTGMKEDALIVQTTTLLKEASQASKKISLAMADI